MLSRLQTRAPCAGAEGTFAAEPDGDEADRERESVRIRRLGRLRWSRLAITGGKKVNTGLA